MTAAKTADLKNQFSNEFASIYQLCELVLIQSQKPSLLAVSLDALLGFLSWIPIAYIFETNMIQLLIDRVPPFSLPFALPSFFLLYLSFPHDSSCPSLHSETQHCVV